MWLKFEGYNSGHAIYVRSQDIMSLEICNGHMSCKDDEQGIKIDIGESAYSVKYTAEALVLLNDALGINLSFEPPKIKVGPRPIIQ